jgi:hypothetical protein
MTRPARLAAMTRIIALTLLCTASLSTGVVVASPSLANVFRTHHGPVHHSKNLWRWSVSGGTTTTAAPSTVAGRKQAKHAHRSRPSAPVLIVASPPPATAPASTTTPPPPASTSSGSPDPAPGPAFNEPFTLQGVDARCFGATPAAGGWPFAPTASIHPIRGSFDEPRDPVHIGVDIEAPKDQAPVYAMQSGTLRNVQPDHFDVLAKQGPKGAYLQYWHVKLATGVHAGAVVRRRQLLGTVKPHMLHVHISEYVPGCGLVNPARPHGLLADPYNTEWPSIGPLTAMAAGPRAWVPLTVGQAPGEVPDPARPVALDALSGTVDLRANVTDTPKVRMQHNPQMPLAPAAIRAYLAPATNVHRHLFMRTIFDGSRLLPTGSPLWHYWAFGTYRQNACYFSAGATCGMRMVWHVGGPHGFNTTTVPDGQYKYCVEALTIAGVDGRRCTVVKISN